MLYSTENRRGGYCGDDKDRCTEGSLVETNGQNMKHFKLYITDKHEHLEQGHMSDTYMDCQT